MKLKPIPALPFALIENWPKSVALPNRKQWAAMEEHFRETMLDQIADAPPYWPTGEIKNGKPVYDRCVKRNLRKTLKAGLSAYIEKHALDRRRDWIEALHLDAVIPELKPYLKLLVRLTVLEAAPEPGRTDNPKRWIAKRAELRGQLQAERGIA